MHHDYPLMRIDLADKELRYDEICRVTAEGPTLHGMLIAFFSSLSTSFNFSSMSLASLIFTSPETNKHEHESCVWPPHSPQDYITWLPITFLPTVIPHDVTCDVIYFLSLSCFWLASCVFNPRVLHLSVISSSVLGRHVSSAFLQIYSVCFECLIFPYSIDISFSLKLAFCSTWLESAFGSSIVSSQ